MKVVIIFIGVLGALLAGYALYRAYNEGKLKKDTAIKPTGVPFVANPDKEIKQDWREIFD